MIDGVIKEKPDNLDAKTLLYYAAGMIVAGIVGYIAIGIVRMLAKQGKFKYFAIYCAAAGLALLLWSVV